MCCVFSRIISRAKCLVSFLKKNSILNKKIPTSKSIFEFKEKYRSFYYWKIPASIFWASKKKKFKNVLTFFFIIIILVMSKATDKKKKFLMWFYFLFVLVLKKKTMFYNYVVNIFHERKKKKRFSTNRRRVGGVCLPKRTHAFEPFSRSICHSVYSCW
jgi:hypothetical protein